MGKHPILTRVHAPKQVPDVMDFAHYENSADLCATDVKELAFKPVQWNLFCPTTRAEVFAIWIPTWLKEEPPLYDQTVAGRLNLF